MQDCLFLSIEPARHRIEFDANILLGSSLWWVFLFFLHLFAALSLCRRVQLDRELMGGSTHSSCESIEVGLKKNINVIFRADPEAKIEKGQNHSEIFPAVVWYQANLNYKTNRPAVCNAQSDTLVPFNCHQFYFVWLEKKKSPRKKRISYYMAVSSKALNDLQHLQV